MAWAALLGIWVVVLSKDPRFGSTGASTYTERGTGVSQHTHLRIQFSFGVRVKTNSPE